MKKKNEKTEEKNEAFIIHSTLQIGLCRKQKRTSISEFGKVSGYRVSVQKLTVFLDISNEHFGN